MRTHPSSEGPRRMAGFALIELLVIIVLIAVLAEIFLAALAATQARTQRTTCVKNLKQLGVAMLLYAHDNHDALAFANWDGGVPLNGGGGRPGWLYTVTNEGVPDVGPGGTYEKYQRIAYQTGLWFPYNPNPKTYLCPADIRSKTWTTPRSQGALDVTVRANKMSSYVMDGAACGFGKEDYTTKGAFERLQDAWNPKCYLLWEPDERGYEASGCPAFAFNDGANYPDQTEGISRRHGKSGGNGLTVSGDVVYLTVKAFRSESDGSGTTGPGGKTLAWWSPLTPTGH